MAYSKGSEWNRWDLHLHTKSSYDYKYKGDDADDLLCQQLRSNGIKAVAITDHWIIDKDRIENLRSLAPDIVFFPGVELRTDKGANNLHVILIFSETANLDELSGDFDAIMLRQDAKSPGSNDTIYWTFEDILKFANSHNALVSIHAGRKANGIDKEITNGVPVNEAIKEDIAKHVDFFEVGQNKDVADYEKHVFKVIERKPLIICSDSHSPKEYTPKEALWIKADCTFEGLKQCLYQPLERVYLGDTPPILDRLQKNLQNNISSISVQRIEKPSNTDSDWFDFEIPINPGMVAIIGSKGSGKSAFSDIVGHLCRCRTMDSASFLNTKRFRKSPKNFACDYDATLTWADGERRCQNLGDATYVTELEDAQYLPQKFIEDVCNDFGNIFQEEIDKVIFSYVDKTERGDAHDLKELVAIKASPLQLRMKELLSKLSQLNTSAINLEKKQTKNYKKMLEDGLAKAEETLTRHEKSKPIVVAQPESRDSDRQYQSKLEELNRGIEEQMSLIEEVTGEITRINSLIDEIRTVIAQIKMLKSQANGVQKEIDGIVNKYDLVRDDFTIKIDTPEQKFEQLISESETKKKSLQETLSNSETGYYAVRSKLETEKASLISSADAEEKLYQKYLQDLKEWNDRKVEIIGDEETDGTIEYYKHELTYIQKQLASEYQSVIDRRDECVRELYRCKAQHVEIYEEIYAPVQGEISTLLGELEDGVTFKAEVYLENDALGQNIIKFINQKFSGMLGRGRNSMQEAETYVRQTDFSDEESVITFLDNISKVVTSDLDAADKRIADRQGFYDFLYGLNYISVRFKLKMGERTLEELSPGERGIVLLIFYLALSKESMPIIIDQPEDNLDNQSVYTKLVPCICRAKKRRQVIIVTHNPNIAVACDAEQIIYCEMDKHNSHISYVSGAIENPEMKKHVIDVLEGTLPAFELRRQKYN